MAQEQEKEERWRDEQETSHTDQRAVWHRPTIQPLTIEQGTGLGAVSHPDAFASS